MEKTDIENKELIYALDIGTRNVVGIIGYEEEDTLHVIASSLIEHKTRAMLDGQIHDILQVSEVINTLTHNLEEQLGVKLSEVAIAAAGRVLKTVTAEGVIGFTQERGINKSHISAMEMQGVEMAKQILYDESKTALDFYCVAYTPIKYYLDGYEMDNLEGHKGCEIRCSIIATFLPKQVVDSLYTAVQNAGLTVSNMTLEPISAINVAIPRNLRLLNLAIVDIGAGTSDIAITKENSISAYGMLPIAGDEFTERLVEEYLVDFNTAEIIKKELDKEKVAFTDILGIEQCIDSKEILEKTLDILEKITEEIAQKILVLNGEKAPKAVFCVGGGSQFPNITGKLSQKLDVPEDRIIVKDISSITDIIKLHREEITGPKYITPVGICLTTMLERKYNFISVTVNGQKVKLLNTKLLTVLDAAIKIDFNSSNLIVQNGKKLEYTLNSHKKKKLGKLGTPAVITINGEISDLKTELKNNDVINIKSAIIGEDAIQDLEELLENIEEKNIIMAGRKILIRAITLVNGKSVDSKYQIKNGDDVILKPIEKLQELMEYLQIEKDEFVFYINGHLTTIQSPIENGDSIEIMLKEVNNNEGEIEENTEAEEKTFVYVNGDKIELEGKENYLLIDIFNKIQFNIHEKKGLVEIFKNGNKASYTDSLSPGDKIEIIWN